MPLILMASELLLSVQWEAQRQFKKQNGLQKLFCKGWYLSLGRGSGLLLFFSRCDENRTVTHDGNITNLVRILEDYSFPIGMTFQDLSNLFKRPVFSM